MGLVYGEARQSSKEIKEKEESQDRQSNCSDLNHQSKDHQLFRDQNFLELRRTSILIELGQKLALKWG